MDVRGRLNIHVAKLALAIPFCLAGGCSTGLEVSVQRPALEGLDVRQVPFVFRGNWGIYVTAIVSPEEPVLRRNTRVPFSIVTESGDAEEMLLRPTVCESETGQPYQCLEFLFMMEDGHHVEEVAEYVDRVDGELRYVAYTGWFAAALIYDGEVDRALRDVRTWPGVAAADRSSLSSLAGLTDSQARALALFVRLEIDDPIPGDGVAQALAGDQVTVTYDPPEGAGQSSSFVMCELGQTDDILSGGGLGAIPPCG